MRPDGYDVEGVLACLAEIGLMNVRPPGAVGALLAGLIGHVVNLAQRLESNASPGHILAAEAVYEAARDLFAEAERKELSVKGRAQAVVAYECRPA